MEAKELRLGNYCKEITHSKNEIVKVSKRHFEEIEDNEIDLFPIPLTEDWLVKFGFVLDLDSHRTTYLSKDITTYMQDGIFWCDILWDCLELKYVHQLQNLYFALTNKELTI
tara:strand:- start:388 stop:723 length:336 start_codon:yes stop_codon:yes gene_type:complete